MSPPSAFFPLWISLLCGHGRFSSSPSFVVELHKVVLERWVLVVGRCKKIHPRVLETLADDRESADPSEEILLASVKSKELEKQQRHRKTLWFPFYKMWPHSVLEIPDAIVWISEQVSIEKWFVYGSVSNKSVFQ